MGGMSIKVIMAFLRSVSQDGITYMEENMDGLSTNVDKLSSCDDDDTNNNMVTWQCFSFCY